MNPKETKNNQIDSNPIDETSWFHVGIGMIVLIIFLIIFIYYCLVGNQSDFHFNAENMGQLGDYIGGLLNPILAFSSFMALLYTIRLQSEELKATRKELAISETAQKKSEEALVKQLEIAQQQQFETTFFSLLEQINKVANKLESKLSSEDNGIGKIINNISRNNAYYIMSYSSYNKYSYNEYNDVERTFYVFKISIHDYLPQFKSFSLLIFQMLKMINSLTDESLKKDYADILKASLHINLLQLLAIYADDIDKFSDENRKLIRKFHLLENIPFNFDDTSFNKKGHVVLFHLINKYRLNNEENAFEGNYYLAYLEEE